MSRTRRGDGAAGLLPLRRVSPAWPALATVVFTALVGATLVGTLAGIGAHVLPEAAAARLAGAPQASVTVIGLGDRKTVRSDTPAIRRSLGQALRSIPYRLDTAIWSGPLAVAAGAAAGQQAEIGAATHIRAHAVLVRGAWPGPDPSGGPIPAAVPVQVAAQLAAAPGTLLRLRDRNSGAPLTVRVTGTYRQREPAADYWNLDQIWTCSASIRNCPAAHGPILVSPSSFGRNGLAVAQAAWVALPDAARIGTGDLAGLAARIQHAQSVLQQPEPGLVVTTGMPSLLRGTATDLAVARSVAAVAAAELLVPAIAALALAAGLLAGHREQETALLTARGADRWQRARLALAEGVPIGIVAAVAGTLAGGAVADLLAPSSSPGPTAVGWLAGFGVLVMVGAVMLWAALRTPAGGATESRGGRRTNAGLVRAGADVALLALAAVAVWQLRTSSVTVPTSGGLGLDPVLIFAPALALAGISVLLLRAVPVGARVADRVSARARRFGTALAAWELGRRPVRQAGPVVLAVFTVAAGTLALAEYSSWQRSAQDQGAFTTGADMRVDVPVAIPLGKVAAVTRAPGVRAAMPATVAASGGNGEVLAIDAHAAPATVLLRRDLSPVPLATLSRRLVPTGPKPGLALPGRPARLRVVAGLAPSPGAGLGPASAAVSIEDASGAVYSAPAGSLPADGQLHGLVATLSATRRADYPLRLLGLTLTYPLPRPASTSQAPPAGPVRLTIASVGVAPSIAGGFGPPLAPGSALGRWRPHASSADLTSLGVPTSAPGSPITGSQPAAGPWHASSGSSQVLSFRPGYAPAPQGLQQPVLAGSVTVAAPPRVAVIPGIATREFAATNGAGVGTTIPVPVGTDTVQVKVVAVVRAFPTVTGPGGGLIVDEGALQELLVNRQSPPLPVTSWWLRTASGAAPPGLPAGSAVSTRARQVATLLGDPLSSAQQEVLLVVAASMVLLAVVGFAANVAVELRAGRATSALLAVLGVTPAAQARLLALEQLLLSVPAALAGLLAGMGLAYVLIPPVTLTATATIPVPPVLVVFPLGREILLAAVVAAVPVVAAAAGAMRRSGRAGQVRLGAAS